MGPFDSSTLGRRKRLQIISFRKDLGTKSLVQGSSSRPEVGGLEEARGILCPVASSYLTSLLN